MTRLSVNVNKIAWLRNARGGARPDVVDCARAILDAGAVGITVHPRPDGRHIRRDDVFALGELVAAYPDAEFNIEGNPVAQARPGYPGFDALIEAVRPQQCTLVPDADDQLASDHGWDLRTADAIRAVREPIERYRALGCRVSLFMEPDHDCIAGAQEAGADRIELYTGPYAQAVQQHGAEDPAVEQCLAAYRTAARYAAECGLGVNAGHDLDLANLPGFVSMGGIAEVSIGHALVADALELGLASTIARYLAVLEMHAPETPEHTQESTLYR